jgi:hypothetical protein
MAVIFAKTQTLLFSPHLYFSDHIMYQIFYKIMFKNAYFSKHDSILCPITKFAIYVNFRKEFSYFRENAKT